jgi:hypothetical protein
MEVSVRAVLLCHARVEDFVADFEASLFTCFLNDSGAVIAKDLARAVTRLDINLIDAQRTTHVMDLDQTE